jgi:beta-glucosidase
VAAVTRFASARTGGDFAAGDRTDLALGPEQEGLILAVAAANPRTVVVLMGGGAILCERWRQRVKAILLLWYPGQQGGEALADVLLGRVSPSGRMPFAVPTDAAHLPPFEPRAERVTYDLWHGYRRLRRQGHAAAFPFGFGLSYSSFSHGELGVKLVASSGIVALSLTVTNTGARQAAEVVQVYLEAPGLLVERPARQLVAFERLNLVPGEVRTLTLAIPLLKLAFFDEASDAFRLEAGLHRLVVARHAEADGPAVELQLRETVLEA